VTDTAADDLAQPTTKPWELGDLVPTRNPLTSKVEQSVAVFLAAAGYTMPAERLAVVCRHPDKPQRHLPLTPDILLTDHKIAVEVDPCDANESGYWTHAGSTDKDTLRNTLLAEAGWIVIRLRLGAKRGMHIGDRDVVAESSGFTRAAQEALLAALKDAVKGNKAKVRFVKKAKAPSRSRQSHIVNIGAAAYTDNGYWATWYPALDKPESHKLRLAAGGRYLYTHGMRFIAEVGLHTVPKELWRDRLTTFLEGADPATLGTTKWPWGPTLLTFNPDHEDAADINRHAEHDKHTIDKTLIWVTTNCDSLARWAPEALLTADERVLAQLHPDAVALGYKFAEVTMHSGRYGPYQRIVITRPDIRPPDDGVATTDASALEG
jgi:hypothetical protein